MLEKTTYSNIVVLKAEEADRMEFNAIILVTNMAVRSGGV